MAFKSQEYTTAGNHTWNVPTGVSCVWVSAAAGGGGGAGGGTLNSRGGAGGGGGGEMCEGMPLEVTPGGTLSITVGAGGVGAYWSGGTWNTPPAGYAHLFDAATGASSGGQGGDTIIGPIKLSGGLGASIHGGAGGGTEANFVDAGTSNQGNQGEVWGSGGEPAFNKNSGKFFSGSGGGQGDWYADWVGGDAGDCGPRQGGTGAGNWGGGGGGSTIYGSGGNGGYKDDSPSAATDGSSYGCGGGGSGGASGSSGLTAGSGAPGYVAIFWYE